MSFASIGQDVKINGGFVEDSLGLGEEIHYWVTAKYPSNLEMVLPDSNYRFSPYELVKREFIPTSSQEGTAYDSVYYTLQSFEIDLVQYLELPAYIIEKGDTTFYKSPLDSILFRELITEASDSLQVKKNIAYRNVNLQFNYPMFLLISGIIVVVLVVLLVIYWKKIIRHFRLKKLRREYEKFSESITSYIRKLKGDPDPDIAERALIDWKSYLQKLEKLPYTTFTTKEILNFQRNQELKETLKSIDRSVYGKARQEEVFKSFQEIEDFTQHRYSLIVERVKNGDERI